jgi:hypothetical protein
MRRVMRTWEGLPQKGLLAAQDLPQLTSPSQLASLTGAKPRLTLLALKLNNDLRHLVNIPAGQPFQVHPVPP